MIPRNRTRPPVPIAIPPPAAVGRVLNSEQIRNRSIDLSFGIIVVILNIAEIILLTRLKHKKKIYEIFLLSLSVADLLFGLSNGIVCITYLSNITGEDVIEFTYTIYFYFVLTSILHLTWMTLDRVWAIYSPMKHNVYVTRRRAYILIAVTWVITTFTAINLYITDEYTETFKSRQSVNYIIAIYDNTTADNVTIYGNSSTLVSTTTNANLFSGFQNSTFKNSDRTRYRTVPQLKDAQGYQHTMSLLLSIFILIADAIFISSHSFILYWLNKKNMFSGIHISEHEEKLSVLCVVIAGTFILFTLPYAIVRLTTSVVSMWVNMLLVSNSGMNCIVYFFRGRCDQYLEKLGKKKAIGRNTPQTLNIPLSAPVRQRK